MGARAAELHHAAVRLVERVADRESVEELLIALDALDAFELVEFDVRARMPHAPKRGADPLESILGLSSRDGYVREAAIENVAIRRSTAALLLVRAADWVPEVREAALRRLDEDVRPELLLDLLPLAEHVASRWRRGGARDALLDAKLDAEGLRTAARSPDLRARRAAWRRVIRTDLEVPRDLQSAGLADQDAGVRALAVKLLPRLNPAERRAAGEWLVGDPVGWIAARGLELLVEAEGELAIHAALTSKRATLRRHARDWALLRGVDAAAVYRERPPDDAIGLIGLAELASAEDAARLRAALRDARAPVRAAALRAMATLDPRAAATAALDELEHGGSGRAGRAAARVLRTAALTDDQYARVEAVARTTDSDSLRSRALSVLRGSR